MNMKDLTKEEREYELILNYRLLDDFYQGLCLAEVRCYADKIQQLQHKTLQHKTIDISNLKKQR